MSSQDISVPVKCLDCRCELETPIVCTGCHKLYPLSMDMDYFSLFQIPRRYRIDVGELRHKFLSISRNVHPDFFGAASDDMKDLSVHLSAELNEALRVLIDPVMRAGYLLELSGGTSASQDRSVPQDVLMDAMELREQLEESSPDPVVLASIKEAVDRRRNALLAAIGDAAEKLDDGAEATQVQLRQLINSVKYFDNLLADLPAG